MAKRICPVCGKKGVSHKAVVCPYCTREIKPVSFWVTRKGIIVSSIIGVWILVSVLGGILESRSFKKMGASGHLVKAKEDFDNGCYYSAKKHLLAISAESPERSEADKLLEIVISEEEEEEAEAERKKQEKEANARKEMFKKQLSAWDGSHIKLARLIKDSMNDPKSYEHVETVSWDMACLEVWNT